MFKGYVKKTLIPKIRDWFYVNQCILLFQTEKQPKDQKYMSPLTYCASFPDYKTHPACSVGTSLHRRL